MRLFLAVIFMLHFPLNALAGETSFEKLSPINEATNRLSCVELYQISKYKTPANRVSTTSKGLAFAALGVGGAIVTVLTGGLALPLLLAIPASTLTIALPIAGTVYQGNKLYKAVERNKQHDQAYDLTSQFLMHTAETGTNESIESFVDLVNSNRNSQEHLTSLEIAEHFKSMNNSHNSLCKLYESSKRTLKFYFFDLNRVANSIANM